MYEGYALKLMTMSMDICIGAAELAVDGAWLNSDPRVCSGV